MADVPKRGFAYFDDARDGRGRIRPVEGEAYINRAIRQIVLTLRGERVHVLLFGSNLPLYIFELLTPFVEEEIRDDLRLAINRFDPDVKVLGTELKREGNTISLSLSYRSITTLGAPGELVISREIT